MLAQTKGTIESLIDLPSYQDDRRLIAARRCTCDAAFAISTETCRGFHHVILSFVDSHEIPHNGHTAPVTSMIRYLCSLDGKFSTGHLATLPVPRFGHADYHLMAASPERFVYSQCHSGVCDLWSAVKVWILFFYRLPRQDRLYFSSPMVANDNLRSGQSRRIHQSASLRH